MIKIQLHTKIVFNKWVQKTLCFLCFILMGNSLISQEYKVITDTIKSEILQEQRKIEIVLPNTFSTKSKKKYGVIYVTDGNDKNIDVIRNAQEFIVKNGKMPPMLIVAIQNTDRNRDFLPTNQEDFPTSGGAMQFLNFFEKELMPYINEKYPSNGTNILYGHSFGGVYAMTALLNKPHLFEAYIAVDPSFWWDDEVMIATTKEKINNPALHGKTLFYTGREGTPYKGMGIAAMDSILSAFAPAALDWKSMKYQGETHGSIRYKSVYDGLKYAYEGYSRKRIIIHPMEGVMLKNQPIKLFNTSGKSNVRYTLDGTEPTKDSKIFGKTLLLEEPAILKTKIIEKRNNKTNKTSINTYTLGKTLPAISKLENLQVSSLKYKYYKGKWDTLPDFSSLKPIKEGKIEKKFDFSLFPEETNYGCVLEGYIKIEEAGMYTFVLNSGYDIKMYINNQPIITKIGMHNVKYGKSYVLPLESGYYPIKFSFLKKGKKKDYAFYYLKPNAEDSEIFPFDLFYSK